MIPVLFAIGVLVVLGLAAGLLLAVASVVMAVPRDEKSETLREVLPGINCGACGYSGCDAYAAAMAHEGAAVGLCSPGGKETADASAAILGVAAADVSVQVALLHCGGTRSVVAEKYLYHGPKSCVAAGQLFGGDRACSFGCLGYGDCAAVCEYGAITVVDGLARIDARLCVGCRKCVSACPKSIIAMIPGKARGVVRCNNCDKGALTRKVCSVGCIGCMKCVRVCEYDAIHVQNSLASIDPEKCVGCGACADNCPVHCITVYRSPA